MSSEVNDAYKQTILKKTQKKTFSDDLLYLLKDWDQIKLKPSLHYGDHFVLVSQQVWSYLSSLFGGGSLIFLFRNSDIFHAVRP